MEKHPNLNCLIGLHARNPIFIHASVVHYLHILSRSLALRFVDGVLPSPVLPAFILNDSSLMPMTKAREFTSSGLRTYSVKTAYAGIILHPPLRTYSPLRERGGRGRAIAGDKNTSYAPISFGFCHNSSIVAVKPSRS